MVKSVLWTWLDIAESFTFYTQEPMWEVRSKNRVYRYPYSAIRDYAEACFWINVQVMEDSR